MSYCESSGIVISTTLTTGVGAGVVEEKYDAIITQGDGLTGSPEPAGKFYIGLWCKPWRGFAIIRYEQVNSMHRLSPSIYLRINRNFYFSKN